VRRAKRHRRTHSRVAPAAPSVAEPAVEAAVQSKQRRNVGPVPAVDRVAALPQAGDTPARPAASAHSDCRNDSKHERAAHAARFPSNVRIWDPIYTWPRHVGQALLVRGERAAQAIKTSK